MASFDRHVQRLAGRAGLGLADLSPSRAMLTFTGKRRQHTLWIVPYENIWEFSCVSQIRFPDTESFPQDLLAQALVLNSANKRGFWCLEYMEDQFFLEYMQNIAVELLTPQEFWQTCQAVVGQVDGFEAEHD